MPVLLNATRGFYSELLEINTLNGDINVIKDFAIHPPKIRNKVEVQVSATVQRTTNFYKIPVRLFTLIQLKH